MRRFSRSNRLGTIEERKNLRKAASYLVGAVVIVSGFLFYGVPLLAKFAVFLGNSRETNSAYTADKTPPGPPRLAPLSDVSNKDKLSVRGFSEIESEVELYLNQENIKSVLTDESGEFLFSEVEIASGSNEIYAVAIDKNKNTSQPSGIIKIFLDQIPPTLTVDSPKDGQVFSGQDKKNLKVSGQTEEDVEVSVNDRAVIVGAGGKFETTYPLSDGEQEVKVVALDKAGNSTEKTFKITFNP